MLSVYCFQKCKREGWVQELERSTYCFQNSSEEKNLADVWVTREVELIAESGCPAEVEQV